MTALGFRPVTPADELLLFAVYAATRAVEMAMVPWDEAQKAAFLQMQFRAQRQHYEAHYPRARHEIILWQEQPVGRLWADWQADRIHILDVALLPRFRGGGVGTAVLREVMAEGASSERPVTIYIEGCNPSLRLFERLGFAKSGETGVHLLMTWLPDQLPSNAAPGSEPMERRSV